MKHKNIHFSILKMYLLKQAGKRLNEGLEGIEPSSVEHEQKNKKLKRALGLII